MNTPASLNSDEAVPSVSLRPEQSGDAAFLFEVFASTREEELARTNWDAPMRRAFLQNQFNAMRQGYRSTFPTAEFSIIEFAGTPIGRLVVNYGPAEIHVVDIALLPARRNHGIGTCLMRRVCAAANKPVRLCVLKNNRAVRWYERLGFTRIGESGFHDEMEWRPPLA